MSRRNYNRISQDNNKTEDVFETTENVFEPEIETVEEQEPKPESKIGRVFGCKILNVRSRPNVEGEIVTRLDKGETVTFEEEVDGWVAVTTAMGIEGYCIKDFIKGV